MLSTCLRVFAAAQNLLHKIEEKLSTSKFVSIVKQSTASKYILHLVYTLYLTVVVTCVIHSHYIVYQFLFTVFASLVLLLTHSAICVSLMYYV